MSIPSCQKHSIVAIDDHSSREKHQKQHKQCTEHPEEVSKHKTQPQTKATFFSGSDPEDFSLCTVYLYVAYEGVVVFFAVFVFCKVKCASCSQLPLRAMLFLYFLVLNHNSLYFFYFKGFHLFGPSVFTDTNLTVLSLMPVCFIVHLF